MHILRFLLAILLSLSLVACVKAPGQAELLDYQQRLTRVLGLAEAKLPLAPVSPLPAKSSLVQPLPELRMDLLDALATRQCGLDQLIAERNSSLGRVFTASKRVNYEVRLLAVLEQCQAKHWDEPLKSQLADVYQQKQQSIHTVFDNMLLADDTLRQRWHNNERMLAPQDSTGFNESLAALTLLVDLKQAITTADWHLASQIDPEQALETLYQYRFLSDLQYSLRYGRSYFAALNPLLTAIEPASLCQARASSEQLTILSTVFRKFFIGEVQAYLAELSRYQQQSWPLIAALYQDTLLYPALEQRYHKQAEQLQQLLLQHVGWYQQLNQDCPVGLTG